MARRLVILAVLLAVPGALVALAALVLCRIALGSRRAAALSARFEARGIAFPFLRPLRSPDGNIDDPEAEAESQPALSHTS